jgi:hypothetical protein
MANMALDSFLDNKEKRLVNLDWLDIDPSEYQNMPFDPLPEYVAIPKLEEAWDHTTDKSKFDLVPNSNMDFNYKMPDSNRVSSEEDVQNLLNYTKQQMMLGKTGEAIVERIKDFAHPILIKEATEHLKKLGEEQGLLGNVYIDPSVFNKCEDGAQFVNKKTKTAKYVKAMDSCSGCVFNKQGRCEVYKKHLAKEIDYTPQLLDFYSKHFTNLKEKEIKLASKSDLQREFLAKEVKKTKVAEFKPKISETNEKTLAQVENDYKKQMDDLKKELSSVKQSKLAKELNFLLVKGYDAKTIRDYVKHKFTPEFYEENKKIFSSVLSKQGSLGSVYVDIDLLPVKSCKDSRDFFKKNVRSAKYILSNCSFCSCGGSTCRNLNKTVVSDLNDIPKEEWENVFNSYDSSITEKLSSVFDKNREQGLRLAFIQSELTKSDFKEPVVESFDLKNSLDDSNYVPKKAVSKIALTPDRIINALDKGFTLSSIIKIGKMNGIVNETIASNIKSAFENLKTINKYQLDVNFPVPENVNVVMSQKDTSIDLDKPIDNAPVLSFDSTSAPVDDMVNEMSLKESNLDLSNIDKKSEDIEFTGLGEFNIE